MKDLKGAGTVEAVVELANDYLDNLPSAVLDRIPIKCRPTMMADESDVHFWRQAISSELASLPPLPVFVKLQDLVVFFVNASDRIFELRDQQGDPGCVTASTTPIASNDGSFV